MNSDDKIDIVMTPDLSFHIAGIPFSNPVLVSAGTFGYGNEFAEVMEVNRLGGVVTKTLTLKPRPGNPAPRVIPVTSGMMNSVGLQNIGIEEFVSHKLPELQSFLKIPLIVSIMGETPEQFAELASRLKGLTGISALELNLSCPNVKAGGVSFGIDPMAAASVVSAVKAVSDYPVFAKLTPNVTDIGMIAKAVENAGADAIVAVNTFNGLSIDIETRQSRLGTWKGGVSGPAIKSLALYQVYQTAKSVKVPVIGMGGILKYSDAVEFLLAGASAVSVGTGNLIEPKTSIKVVKGLESYCSKHNIEKLSQLVGQFKIG